MASIRPTVKARRIEAFLAECTLSTYLRRGKVWETVVAMRAGIAAQGGAPCTGIPPRDVDPCPPALWVTGADFLGQLPSNLSLDFEPRRGALRIAWGDVACALALYDPPRDQLLDYADRLAEILGRHDRTATDPEPKNVTALPIRHFVEPSAVHEFWLVHEHNMLWILRNRLAERGVEIAERDWADLCMDIEGELLREERASGCDRYGPVRPYIAPDGASKADVIAAYDHLVATGATTAGRGSGAPDGRPPRDPLLCVQVALWHDEARLSYAEIGARMGWTIQRPPGMSPRCETARQHAERGRELLEQRNAAA